MLISVSSPNNVKIVSCSNYHKLIIQNPPTHGSGATLSWQATVFIKKQVRGATLLNKLLKPNFNRLPEYTLQL